MDKARKRIGNEEWVIRKDESKKRNLEEESGPKKKHELEIGMENTQPS